MLKGNGDATGLKWIREAGLLISPIAFTHSLGVVRNSLIALARKSYCKYTHFSCTLFFEISGFSAISRYSSGVRLFRIHGAAHCSIQSASAPRSPVLHSVF